MRGFFTLRSALVVVSTLVLSTASAPSSRSSAAVDADGARLVVEVVDQTGQKLVSRVQVEPRGFGERLRSAGRAPVGGPTKQGKLAMALPAGRYRVRVSRGIEWSQAQFDLELAPGQAAWRRVTLSHQVHMAGYEGADLHVHTRESDDATERGGVSSADLLAEGVTLAAITDHNEVNTLRGDIETVGGAEVTTWAPEVGHFNAFPLAAPPDYRGTTPAALVRALQRDPNVFVQVNHPRLEDHIAYFELGRFDGERFGQPGFHMNLDGLEVYNGYDLGRPRAVRALVGEFRRWVARGHRLTATGGSDSHGPRGHLPGYPRTYVAASTAAELAPALKAGRAFVTNGPLVDLRVSGRGPGERTAASARNRVEVTVRAADWLRVEQLELWADDRLLLTQALPRASAGEPLDVVVRRTLDLRGARTVTALVRGGDGLEPLLGRDVEPLAFTNPVYLTR